jgi:hypothetical protein
MNLLANIRWSAIPFDQPIVMGARPGHAAAPLFRDYDAHTAGDRNRKRTGMPSRVVKTTRSSISIRANEI